VLGAGLPASLAPFDALSFGLALDGLEATAAGAPASSAPEQQTPSLAVAWCIEQPDTDEDEDEDDDADAEGDGNRDNNVVEERRRRAGGDESHAMLPADGRRQPDAAATVLSYYDLVLPSRRAADFVVTMTTPVIVRVGRPFVIDVNVRASAGAGGGSGAAASASSSSLTLVAPTGSMRHFTSREARPFDTEHYSLRRKRADAPARTTFAAQSPSSSTASSASSSALTASSRALARRAEPPSWAASLAEADERARSACVLTPQTRAVSLGMVALDGGVASARLAYVARVPGLYTLASVVLVDERTRATYSTGRVAEVLVLE